MTYLARVRLLLIRGERVSNLNAVEFGSDAVRRFSENSSADVSLSEKLAVIVELTRVSGRRFMDETHAMTDVLGDEVHPSSGLAQAIGDLLQVVSVPAPVQPAPFPAEMVARLGVYVYALVDPTDGRPFYIGKGRGNRVFQHVWSAKGAIPMDNSENVGAADSAAVTSKKNTRIHQVFAAGFGVQHWIIRHGITSEDSADKVAFGAEQCLLDFAGLAQIDLVNLAGGHVATDHGMLTAEELTLRYCAEPVPALPAQCALIKVNAAAKSATPEQIYQWSREAWIVGDAARAIHGLPILVFANDIVRAVHRADSWTPVGTLPAKGKRAVRKWRYLGEPDPELEKIYVGKSLREVRAQRPDRKWRQHGWHPYLVEPATSAVASSEGNI